MPDVSTLVQRLREEFDTARERAEARRLEAVEAYHQKKLRYAKFLEASQRVGGLLEPRIDAFTHFFQGIDEKIDILRLGAGGSEVHGAFVTFSFPHTAECPASITLKFSLGHDSEISQLVLDYDLAIVPVYLHFDKHDSLRVPLDAVDDEVVTAWFDERLTRFTQTYLNMLFIPQYQEESLVPDRVLGITFPRSFAVGKVEHRGVTYYFYTQESLADFKMNPDIYLNGPAS